MSAAQRTALYAVAAAAVALLAAYRVITAEQAPLWLALATALLGVVAPVTAIRHVTPDDDPEDGDR